MMERMNDDIPFEHQMMFIIRDYDRKVEENVELREKWKNFLQLWLLRKQN